VSRYEQHTGTGLTHLAWYRYLAATRVAVLMHRYLRAMVHAGRLPADHRLLADTVATRRLASLSPA
jgi:aminoglycoside phosphotransferase (APT) family kinase protein